MIDFDKELNDILANDPLGLLDVRAPTGRTTPDERLVNSFKEINTFVQREGREPAESRDIHERRLFARLKGLREDPVRAAALQEHDEHSLLADVALLDDMETSADILEHDPLGLLGGEEEDPNDIFNLRNVPKEINTADHIARRKPCKNFEEYEPLFKQCHEELRAGVKIMRRFASEKQIQAGRFFVLQGQLVFVESIGEREQKGEKINARMHCIFESGTESNMLLRSLSTPLSKDPTGRVVLDKTTELSGDDDAVSDADRQSGFVYVLKSNSADPQISEIENLYKIGFSTTSVEDRIKNAERDPTYLMAEVSILAEYQVFNVSPRKIEHLLHRFFSEACLQMDVFDSEGRRHSPREWFRVPMETIEHAIELLVNGEIVHHTFDADSQSIVLRD